MKKDYILINGTLMHADDYLMDYGRKGMKWRKKKKMPLVDGSRNGDNFLKKVINEELENVRRLDDPDEFEKNLKGFHEAYKKHKDNPKELRNINAKKNKNKYPHRINRKVYALASRAYGNYKYDKAKANRTK